MHQEGMETAEKYFAALVIVINLIVIIVLSYLTGSALSVVFVGMTPSYIHLLLLLKLYPYRKNKYWLVWITPLILSSLFLILWKAKVSPLLSSMEGPTIAILNLFVSYFSNLFFLFEFYEDTWKTSLEKEVHHLRSKVAQYEQKIQKQEENLTVNLRSIEDKCKAINFVIGRVYSDKKGGSPEIRRKLHIDPDWYNQFSEISAHPEEKSKEELSEILQKIIERLNLLERPEKEVVLVYAGRILLERRPGDTILDVLARNDKDPVKEYHAEAKEIAMKLISLLQGQVLSS